MLGNGQAEQLKQCQNGDQTVSKKKLALCLNLRDVGATMPDKLRTGMIFRSSQLLRCDFDAADHPYCHFSCRRRGGETCIRVKNTSHKVSHGLQFGRILLFGATPNFPCS